MATTLLVSACNTDNNLFENVFYKSTSTVSTLPVSTSTEANTLHVPHQKVKTDQAPRTTNKSLNKISQENETSIVASIGSRAITLDELDARIQLGLFDLEWQKYQLRKEALHAIIFQDSQATTLADKKTIITLIPPTPPKVGLPKDQRPIMGTPNAAIIIDVFCSYQSSHCARLYPILSELKHNYSEMVGLRFFDYPQRFHRYGVSAANAFRCAAEYTPDNKTIWAFQSALYADINQLNPQRYMNIAQQLGINSPKFETCLIEKHHQQEISKDLAFGKQIGLGNVPVVFINGLYLKGANPLDMYSYYIEQELNLMAPSKNIQQSQLPITLLATTVSNIQSQSTAEIINQKIENVIRVKIGEQIFPQVSIVDIQTNQILINNKGITEFIKIKASHGHQLADDTDKNIPSSPTNSKKIAANNGNEEDNLVDNNQRRSLPVTGEMTLSRDWVDKQLLDQTSLEKHFHNAEHIVEGNHLIKLDNIDNQRFYTTLGLKTGDVIMRVNEQWVHETQNPLWASLQQNESVTLTVMRKGLPYRYDYRIE